MWSVDQLADYVTADERLCLAGDGPAVHRIESVRTARPTQHRTRRIGRWLHPRTRDDSPGTRRD